MRTILYLLLSITSFVFLGCSQQKLIESIDLSKNWKFITGDSMLYASPSFDDSKWKDIDPTQLWEKQGYADYDGYAWYRFHFFLPTALKMSSFYKDSLQVFLDLIDDADQSFINGKLLGENGKLVNEKDVSGLRTIPDSPDAYRISRRYVISVSDLRLQWDKENVLAIRVFDHGGGGGMYGKGQSIRMMDVRDYLKMDLSHSPLRLMGVDSFSKKIGLINLSSKDSYEGTLTAEVIDAGTNKRVYTRKEKFALLPSNVAKMEFAFNADQTKKMVVFFRCKENKSGKLISSQMELPYMLTPKSPESPRINGASVYGQRANKPFLYLIAATGIRPITFSASNLPDGLSLDSNTGIISGSAKKEGEYTVKLRAVNEKGNAERDLKIIIGSKLALTPPLGWNSWNCWGLSVDAAKVKNAADRLVSSGLANHGWTFINIDDGWEAPKRLKNGEIMTNEKFPDMNSVTDYVHSKGLKMGIYSSPGPQTCGGFLGSYNHEEQDVKSWAKWGIDYIKYDWCSYDQVAKNKSLEELKKPYIILKQALDKASRDIVFSLCQYGMGDVWKWGGEVGGNLWRTTGDISDSWESMYGIGFSQVQNAEYSKPGNWNDPDMLVVGWVGWGPSLHPSQLSASEQYTHISLWALLSAPMLIGCDLEQLDDFTLNLLSNDEVIEIDQDPLGRQARPVEKTNMYEIWAKELEDGSRAVGLFNVSPDEKVIKLNFDKLSMSGKHLFRDVWRQKDLGEFEGTFETKVDSHDVLLLRIK
jgi:alpha-galactosidase